MAPYDTIGRGYAAYRRPDPRIASAMNAALGEAESVVNVGAGAGSYEPSGRTVLGVETSEVMIRQRAARAASCVQGSGEAPPVQSASFDACMAIPSAHHWQDLEGGFREMAHGEAACSDPHLGSRRNAVLTDAGLHPGDPAYDRTIFPTSTALTAMLERTLGPVRMSPLPIPHDCADGMLCAYWRRPECYLDAERRNAISSFARIDAAPGLAMLRADLSSERWAERNRRLLTLDALDVGYRIACCEVSRTNS